jgi:integrator complex subunit 11
VEGTLGNRLLRGAKEVKLDNKTYEVKMKVVNVSFSAHADAKGIINLLRNIDPENIMLVHGDRMKMEQFAPLVQQQLSKPVFMPANFERISIDCIPHSEIQLASLPTASEGFLFSHAA